MTDPLKTGTPLQAAQLRARIDLSFLDAGTTGQTAPSQGLLGQDRALDAIRMAAKISHDDFNLFVLGPQGYGRNTAVRRILQDEARQRPVPSDWIYVNNFDQPGKPKAIELPARKSR